MDRASLAYLVGRSMDLGRPPVGREPWKDGQVVDATFKNLVRR